MSSKHDVPERGSEQRREGSGKWLEERIVEAFENRWQLEKRNRERLDSMFPDLDVETDATACAWRRGDVWGQEIDVFSVTPMHGRFLVQSKDWDPALLEVTPRTIWRLIALSYTVRAEPVLVTDARLTPRARQIADYWRVTRWSISDVMGEEWPGTIGNGIANPRWCNRFGGEEMRREMVRYGPSLAETRPNYYRG